MATVQYKTPGVYIEELDAFPPSIVGVETAVPVFIGYTEKAERNGRSVKMQPVRIGSMVEYHAIFGGAYPYKFTVEKMTSPPEPGNADAVVKIGGDYYRFDPVKKFNFYYCIKLFYANGGNDCYILSVGSNKEHEKPSLADLQAGLDAARDVVGPTMLVIPGATGLAEQPDDRSGYNTLVAAMLKQCYEQQDRVALIDVFGTDVFQDEMAFKQTIKDFRSSSSVTGPNEYLRYGIAYAPFLKTSIVAPDDISFENFDPACQTTLMEALEKEVNQLYPTTSSSSSSVSSSPPAPPQTKAQEIRGYFTTEMAKIRTSPPPDDHDKQITQLNQNLTAQIPVLKDIYAAMAAKIGTLPPSPAMAGVYTVNDVTRGVWNAPANVGLVAVTEPLIRINNRLQDDLNMPVDGLAINAIRGFAGRGTLVWGARTLDGNSNDWRYIQVRRVLIYIEQSIELALNKFVFEPNVAQTWVTVTSMIGSFLRGVWQAGGLMGTSPQEAFSVQCGLGSTMTAQDVLEGRMNVQIKLTLVHPAEFIVLVFQQQMQGGAG